MRRHIDVIQADTQSNRPSATGPAASVIDLAEPAAPRTVALDPLDRALINELLVDGRASQEELSRRVRLSRPAVAGRMRRLEDGRVVRGYTAVLDWELVGYPMLAFVWIRTSGGNCRDHARNVAGLGDGSVIVEDCHRVTGEWCLFAKVRARSAQALEGFIDRLRELPQISATMTTLSLSSTSQ